MTVLARHSWKTRSIRCGPGVNGEESPAPDIEPDPPVPDLDVVAEPPPLRESSRRERNRELPPPDSNVDTIERFQEKLRAWDGSEVSEAPGWITGFGYDDSQLAEGRHPTRDDLEVVEMINEGHTLYRRGK